MGVRFVSVSGVFIIGNTAIPHRRACLRIKWQIDANALSVEPRGLWKVRCAGVGRYSAGSYVSSVCGWIAKINVKFTAAEHEPR